MRNSKRNGIYKEIVIRTDWFIADNFTTYTRDMKDWTIDDDGPPEARDWASPSNVREPRVEAIPGEVQAVQLLLPEELFL